MYLKSIWPGKVLFRYCPIEAHHRCKSFFLWSVVWILAEKSPGQLIELCNIYLHEIVGFRLMCGWYNRCSGGHFAFCPVAAETFCGRKKRHVVRLIWLIAPYADSPIGNGLSLLPFPHCKTNFIFKSSAPQLEERFPSSEPTLHVLYSHHEQNVSQGKVPKQQIFLLIVGSQFFTKSECESVCLPPLQFVAFVKFHIRPQSVIPQRNDQSIL